MIASARWTMHRILVAGAGGQGVVEYGLILALTSLLTLLWLFVFGGAIADALTIIGEAIDQAAGG